MKANKVIVVTSFNKEGYDLYGKKFLETFDQHWPEEISLEVHVPYELVDELYVMHRDTKRAIYFIPYGIANHPYLFNFIDHYTDRNILDGITASGLLPNGKYAMKYDAIKFAWKSFAIISSTHWGSNVIATDYFWLDADTITHSKVTAEDINSWIGNDKNVYTRYLGREQNPKPMYSECGFVYYNTAHKQHARFMNVWEDYYRSGDIFHLPEWHDSFIYDTLRQTLLKPDESVSWTAHLPNASSHPFIQVFGKWMDHRKGPRKHSRTGKHELVVRNDAEYWQ